MKWTEYVLALAVVAVMTVGGWVLVTAPAHADTQTKAYVPKVQQAKLISTNLAATAGLEANVIRVELPPGYVGGKHFHSGDVFVYVEDGAFTVDVAGKETTFTTGQVYHETPNVPMLAKNLSTTDGTTIVVFQVGEQGEPIMIKSD